MILHVFLYLQLELQVPQFDMKKLRNALLDIRAEWYSLGIELDVDEGTRDVCKPHYSPVGTRENLLLFAVSNV